MIKAILNKKRKITGSIFLLMIMLMISTGSKAQQFSSSVVGGQNADNNYPFFINLQDPGTTGIQPFCGASLIAPRWVLTAGHCAIDFFTGQPADELEVVVNSYSLTTPNSNHEKISSDFIAVHSGFDINGADLSDDIALIHLATPSVFSTITLPVQDDLLSCAPGTATRVLGFGVYDTADLFAQPDTLQMADISIISNLVCNEPTRHNGGVTNGMICSGRITGSSIGAGAGDSGGPLMVNTGSGWMQVGIVSWGNGAHSTPTHPGVYTRVSAYRDWIDSTITAYENNLGLKSQGKFDQPVLSVHNDKLHIAFSKELPTACTYSVYDMTGKVIRSGSFNSASKTQELYISEFASGMYILKVDSKEQTYATGKFIK